MLTQLYINQKYKLFGGEYFMDKEESINVVGVREKKSKKILILKYPRRKSLYLPEFLVQVNHL